MKLITSQHFAGLNKRAKFEICNGTGSAGTPQWIVSILDSFDGLGINFRDASDRHDCGYYFARTANQKIKADFIFLLNMLIISINACLTLPISNTVGNVIFLPFRAVRALLYFSAVFVFGWLAWHPKRGHKK